MVPSSGAGEERSLQERLVSWGVSVNDALYPLSVRTMLNCKFVIEDVILDAPFGGYKGLTETELAVDHAVNASPRLPGYVYEERSRLEEPSNNRPKAYLESCDGAIIDSHNVASLRIGRQDNEVPSGTYDYWTTKAVVASVPTLQREILNGQRRLEDVGRRFDLVLSVVTSDGQLVLAKRGRNVANAQKQWMASVGESLDADQDQDERGIPHPARALRRCLHEHDELNLPWDVAQRAQIRFLGLATEWQYLYVNVLALVELDIGFQQVADLWCPGEHDAVASVPFTLDSCLPLVQSGLFRGLRSNDGTPLVPVSRMSLLLALMCRFGFDEVSSRIR